ncbi:WhiB family transcriptional regulator [Streptomyces sp. NRRL S-1813]|uniref:WhiB family transcriptional regulator n=1 Tax=Streptomyces sp. NRRL S-1813 TaxID=1463888 RepID=UPI002D21D59B|nr:WhiB family transcriptional regulator [Streptomyces sp. NRRL S-1813]
MRNIVMPRRVSAEDWRRHSACRAKDVDAELFFPTGDTGPALLQIDEAKAVCRRCPVMMLCQEWALTSREPDGVWGGLSEAERRNVLRRRAYSARARAGATS